MLVGVQSSPSTRYACKSSGSSDENYTDLRFTGADDSLCAQFTAAAGRSPAELMLQGVKAGTRVCVYVLSQHSTRLVLGQVTTDRSDGATVRLGALQRSIDVAQLVVELTSLA